MKITPIRSLLLLAAMAGGLAACADSTAPEVAPAGGPNRGLLGGLLVNVLQRVVPLSQNLSTSATIGTAGGTLQIPAAGFTLTVPAGAVSAPVTIQATALAGGNVAYSFEPHGLVFLKDPVVTQDLSLTSLVGGLLGADLGGGYFANDSDLKNGYATITEQRPATVNLLALRMSFTVHHFSGYVATSGKKQGGYITSSGDRLTPRGGSH
jgi:hypothetical protein